MQRKQTEECGKFDCNELREKRLKAGLYFALESAAKSINDMILILKEKDSQI